MLEYPNNKFTMAALEAATQPASVSERKEVGTSHAETRRTRSFFSSPRPPRLRVSPLAPANACALGGRVKPGHGDLFIGFK
jgi:hypothetical protein